MNKVCDSFIPNMMYLAPTSKEEYFAMLNWSIEQNEHPVAIRIPCNGVISDRRTIDTNYSNLNKFKVEIKGENVAIIALGDFYQLGENVIKELKNKIGLNATLINKSSIFYGTDNIKVKNYGIKKDFYDKYDVNELLKANRLTKEQIVEDIKNMI